jgi:protein-S-isoprenylcysteine O-methyltransferase Ste14
MEKLIIFGFLSFIAVFYSWRTLFTVKSHGFYRFFSWICTIWIFSNNYPFWFDNPFSVNQILSWIFLLISMYLVFTGALLILRYGKASESREDKKLFSFEKTTGLVDTGIYKYIRHPIYGSLIFLTWGIAFKNISVQNVIFASVSTILLYLTSRYDEKECIAYFGEEYKNYMKRSKMFIPYIL